MPEANIPTTEHLAIIKDRFACKYRVTKDECGDFIIELRGGKGFVYAYSETILAAYIQSGQPMRTLKRLKRDVPAVTIEQAGDHEMVVLCPIEHATAFLRVCGAKTRAQRAPLSEEHKQRLIEAGRKHRFPSRPTGLDSGKTALESTQADMVDDYAGKVV